MPRLVINGRFLQRPVTGVERFAAEIIRAADRLRARSGHAQQVILAVPPGTPRTLELQTIQFHEVGSRQGHLWEQIDLPLFCGSDFLVNLCNTGPAFKAAQAVVIHDAAVFSVPQAYSLKFRMAYKLLHRVLAFRARHIMTVSQFSKKELIRHLGIAAHAIEVIPESGEHILRSTADDSILQRHGLAQRPFVLAVSSAQQNKNFSFVVRAISSIGDPGFDVVVAGGTNPAVFSPSGEVLPPFIKHVGYVSEGQLKSLYQHAACFIFPSIYEGFGLPPLEAMNLGCPVLASSSASMPEVCGEGAIYFDPVDPASFLKALDSIMRDPVCRALMKEKALTRSKAWSWEAGATSLFGALLNAREATT